MTTTLVIFAFYALAVLYGLYVLAMVFFRTQIDQLMKRAFPNFMTRRALRAEQQFEDREQARRRERELEQQQLLDWAYTHPDTPEGRRRLLNEVDEVRRRLQQADRDVERATYMLGIVRDVDKAEYEMKLTGARRRQTAESHQLDTLGRTLGLEDDEEPDLEFLEQ